jgi:hypothetical protein
MHLWLLLLRLSWWPLVLLLPQTRRLPRPRPREADLAAAGKLAIGWSKNS